MKNETGDKPMTETATVLEAKTETTTELQTFYFQCAGGHLFVDSALHEGNELVCEPVQAPSRQAARAALHNTILAAEMVRGAIIEIAVKAQKDARAPTPVVAERMHEGVFSSAHEALVFAFTFKTQQYPRTPMTQLLAGGKLGNGRGLGGLDGAGQAGMVLQMVDRLEPEARAVVIGRYSVPVECPCCGADAPSQDYSEAIELLSHGLKGALEGTTCNSRVRRELVRRYLGGNVSMTVLASSTGIERRTLTNHYSRVVKKLAQIEKRARATLDELLEAMVVSG